VRLVVSGPSAFVDVITWSGVVAAAVFTLFALVGAIRPSKDVTWKQRIFLAAVAVGVPAAAALLVAHGDDSLLISLGATAYFITGILLYVVYDERRKARADAVKECPDGCELLKKQAHVCRYCGYHWSEQPVRAPTS